MVGIGRVCRDHEALHIAYGVVDDHPFWKTRLRAIGLGVVTVGLVSSALAVMIVGPRFGAWLGSRIYLSAGFVLLWLIIHWAVAIVLTLVAVELLYFIAPNVQQRFWATLPGAIFAVACWLGLSYLLGFYFRHAAKLSRTYGTLAGFMAFMTWFSWNSFASLVGAELNSELAKESAKGQLPLKEQPAARTLVVEPHKWTPGVLRTWCDSGRQRKLRRADRVRR